MNPFGVYVCQHLSAMVQVREMVLACHLVGSGDSTQARLAGLPLRSRETLVCTEAKGSDLRFPIFIRKLSLYGCQSRTVPLSLPAPDMLQLVGHI